MNISIDWSKAPAWAKYHAFDGDGRGGWHQEKPTIGEYGFWVATGYKWPSGNWKPLESDWKYTLTERQK